MDPVLLGVISLLVLSVFLVSGMRIAYATAICGFIGLWILRGYNPAAGLAGYLPSALTARYPLLVIPLFILMGYFAYYAGITRDIFWTARQWFGRLPGGLAIATIFGSAGFAAACGASTAAAAVMGRVALPELKKYGYDTRVSAGCVAAGGTMASMIPPSVLMVIYGIIAEESIGALLLAGFLPGLLEAVSYSAMLLTRFKFNPKLGPPIYGITWSERFKSVGGTSGIVILVMLVMASIYRGWATPTEAAGVGALGALVLTFARFELNYMRLLGVGVLAAGIAVVLSLGLFTPGQAGITGFILLIALTHAPTVKMGWRQFKEAFLETGRTTAMIFAIVVGILIFVHFLGFTGMPAALSKWVVKLDMPPTFILICILFMYLILGMFLDGIGMLLLTIPIVLPAVRELGINPIMFGVLVVRMIEVGLITPPLGLNVYVLKGVAPDIPMGDIFRGCGWFVFVDLINVAILIAFPQIILFIPETMIK
ncbi:MAG: TRAP transporter large permease [SAR324 cluster bacterium]|nr:TRAP transporter large permease [SAR324 cluster bacterium]MCZ6730142.1 TRAP transporter large permease [SAR324 cluster bacterium]MCZ6842604.1 TRAP transporter large permease [SAR324 cluster bacterium]